MEAPKRRFEIVIKIGADDWAKLCHEIEYVSSHVLEHGPKCDSMSGSPSSSHSVEITERPEMTNERYFANVKAFLDARRPK